VTEPVDPVAALITAWVEWDTAAAAMGERERKSKGRNKPTAQTLEREAHAKEAALAALGIDSTHAHETIAAIRHAAPSWIPGGLSVGDAVQAYLNDHHPLKETP
jgi:hypothetical protein